ncbi:alkyldihydroxyacetonephosphate synthase [Frankia sp. R43]|uniref:FAD-binding oxidoreductase n=1 Tax=Frankia sp. R43 TaxID=269536 RepID=UPI0006CA4F16|nr:FAD-binding oxidoreductase [Frankia sp. R43]KPM56764.1 alkyldihydroxyacetonephosphate synthase [Frankia sp. R43]
MTSESGEHSDAPGGDPVWWGWGAAEAHHPLPAAVRDLLAALGIAARPSPPVDLADVLLAQVRLPVEVLIELRAVVGADHVLEDREARVRHCRGRSTVDLLRLRAGDASDAPDVVVVPADHAQVLAVLRICSHHRVIVVPFGGGTSVVGGLVPSTPAGTSPADGPADTHIGVVALDLRRLDSVREVDPVSGTAVLGAGLRGPAAEALLAEHGLTLGHVPQSWEYATIGGFAATRSSGQASAGYGRFDQLVTGLRVATPVGTWEPGRGPASAAGPDLRQLALGSEGAFGVITEVTVRVRPLPRRRRFEGWRVANLAAGLDLLRELAQRDLLPTVCRLSDEVETAAGLANAVTAGTDVTVPATSAVTPTSLPVIAGCYLLTGYEGGDADVTERATAVGTVITAAGGLPLGERVGQDWLAGRFHAPYLRDALLDEGILAETLETAAYWRDVARLYAAVGRAVTDAIESDGSPAVVLCHVSHVYPAGASLYFTIVCAQGPDPISRWSRAKQAAGDAIMANGGTITHHHAVGTEHRPWVRAEIGDVGVTVLRAVKAALDPAGILNPGILLPPQAE